MTVNIQYLKRFSYPVPEGPASKFSKPGFKKTIFTKNINKLQFKSRYSNICPLMETPQNYKILYPKEQIDARIAELAKDIGSWAAACKEKDGKDILSLPVMSGAIFFYADLVRAINTSVEVTPISARSYVNNSQQQQVDIELANVRVQGRSVLLVDDICDSGRTLEKLKATLEAEGASEIRSAVLLERKKSTEYFRPDYIGFEYEGDEWFVGYGMDDKERFRNLPEIYVIS